MAITLDGTTGITAPGVTDTGNLSVAGTSTLTGSIGNITAGTINSGAITSSGLVTGTTGALYPIINGTAVASTSGTSIDFTSIPSWAKRVNVVLSGVSTTGTSPIIVRLGTSSGIDSTGYSGVCGNRALETFFTTSFIFGTSITAADTSSGQMFVSNVTGNTWSETSILGGSSANAPQMGAGTKALSGALDRVRITTVNGTDTFDAGTINIQYE
jgi:hypothetical protein